MQKEFPCIVMHRQLGSEHRVNDLRSITVMAAAPTPNSSRMARSRIQSQRGGGRRQPQPQQSQECLRTRSPGHATARKRGKDATTYTPQRDDRFESGQANASASVWQPWTASELRSANWTRSPIVAPHPKSKSRNSTRIRSKQRLHPSSP